MKTQKCRFAFAETKYIGFIVSQEGVKVDPERSTAIQSYPVPTSAKHVKKFLGLTSYYRDFIPGYTEIAEPLSRLTRNEGKVKVKFQWSTECTQAFKQFLQALASPPILSYPDFSKEFRLVTDASAVGVGAVLAQVDEFNREAVICYASRSLNSAERRYSTIERELLAVRWAVRRFHPYLGGHFQVLTDHKPLVHLTTCKLENVSRRLEKFIMDLVGYDCKIIYKPGELNTSADAMSRVDEQAESVVAVTRADENEKFKNEDLIEWQNEEFPQILEAVKKRNGRLYYQQGSLIFG